MKLLISFIFSKWKVMLLMLSAPNYCYCIPSGYSRASRQREANNAMDDTEKKFDRSAN
jgi:hypothetical protein